MDFNTADVTSLLSGYSASDWSTFKSDSLSNGFVSAWTSRVNVPSFWQTAMAGLTTQHKTFFEAALQCTSVSLADPSCEGLDLTVSITDLNSGVASRIYIVITADIQRTTNGYRTSFSISFVNKS